MFSKLSIGIALLGLFFVSLLLFTNHLGFAIKITNYTFGIIFVAVLAKIFLNENKKK